MSRIVDDTPPPPCGPLTDAARLLHQADATGRDLDEHLADRHATSAAFLDAVLPTFAPET